MADASGLTAYQKIKKRGAALWDDANGNRATWAKIGEYVYPWRNAAVQSETADAATRRSLKIINGAAGLALNTFRAGMMAGNTPQYQTWFKVTLRDRKLAEGDGVKQFLQDLTDAVYEDFANSNTYPSLALVWGDEGLYGTAAMLVIPDTEEALRCYAYPIGTYALGQDARGAVNQFYREYTMTASQLEEEFGREALSQAVLNLLEQGNGEKRVDVCHLIAPNDSFYANASKAEFKRWGEWYYEKSGYQADQAAGKFLRKSGYDDFPVICPRWESAGLHTPYGVGIGVQILGDVMQLQLTTKDEANAIEFQNNPAMKGPATLRDAFVNRRPGKYTAIDIQAGQGELEKLFENDLRIDHVEQVIGRLTVHINEAFRTDLFKQFTGPVDRLPKTAYLAQKMFLEKVANLLPVLEQQNRELLSPLIRRAIQIMVETGRLLPPGSVVPEGARGVLVVPDSLDGADLAFEYMSPFAEAQRAEMVGQLETFLSYWAQLSAAMPQMAQEIANKISTYDAVDESADGYSIPPKVIRSADEVAELDAAQAEAMAQAQAAQAAPQAAKTVKDLGSTPLGGETALSALTELQGAA